jgi:MFS family permease
MGKHRWITNFTAIRFFLGGIEIYIIAPTAWYYIRSMGQTKFFLALVFTAYNVGAIFAGPLFGFITDRFGNPRFMFICCCAMKVFASVMYSVNISAYFPLFGRLMTGLSGDIAILLGQVALQTDEESRGANFVFLEGVYCLGSVFGPGIGSFISFSVNILGWEIDDGNSPGIVLAIIYLVFLIASLFLPKEVWVESGNRSKEPTSRMSDREDEKELINHQDRDRNVTDYSSDNKPSVLLESRIFCLFFLIFTSEVFSSTATFYAPVLALDHFHLQVIHVKLLFLNCTLFTLLLFICLHIASKYVHERKLFALALLLEIIAISFLTSLAISWNQVTSNVQYYILLIYVCLGMPYFANPFGNSILSKIAGPKNATFVQGLSLATVHSAIAICRVVVSFAFTKTSLICYCFGMVMLWLAGAIWYVVLYERMVTNV